ncbi:MAG: drug/metabolite transporter (DMT)-like permease [Cryomorphaceae bacterium]|jgi:drug/metabolite transporter (DMT)-like permease
MKFDKFSVPLAFLVVLMIWSTTPLAIQWSSAGAPMASALLRMTIGMLFTLSIITAMRIKLPTGPAERRVYAFSGMVIYINMSLFYMAAQLIPSGWIAVLFGLSPLLTGLFASFVEPESRLTPSKVFGLLLGVMGLYLVFAAGASLEEASMKGVVLTLIATVVASSSSVITRQLVKPLDISGMQITAGSLIVAVPLFAITVWFVEPTFTFNFSQKALASTLYLGFIGTGVGFTLYYFLLKRMSASRISLITLITPISGLSVGSWLNGEPLLGEIWMGAALVCTGLLIYEFKPRLGLRKL